MAKYSYEIELQVLHKYINGKDSYKYLTKKQYTFLFANKRTGCYINEKKLKGNLGG